MTGKGRHARKLIDRLIDQRPNVQMQPPNQMQPPRSAKGRWIAFVNRAEDASLSWYAGSDAPPKLDAVGIESVRPSRRPVHEDLVE